MDNTIHRDSLAAWRALRDAGALDLDDRDEDLSGKLKEQLDPSAPNLEHALAGATTDQFLSALFVTIQPFVAMYKDILAFFQRAGARQGQSQWRISVGEEFLELRHFEEFLQHWNSIEVEFDVPALHLRAAFFLKDVRVEATDEHYHLKGPYRGRDTRTGVPDVDAWLDQYVLGQYAPLPASLLPEKLPPGLSDAATVILAALTLLRRQGLTREQVIQAHTGRGSKAVDDDAFHLWSIAQSETDSWLFWQVVFLTDILQRPAPKLRELATQVADWFAPFPRRRIPGTMDVRDLERLLSLPAWKHRYETYGVWIATQILGALKDHDIRVHSDEGQLKFAFREAKIADVTTAKPKLSLIAERRVALIDPLGKSRKEGAQPDFGLWVDGREPPECALVVEVKHYKRRSRRNFKDALTDYARAHPRADVVLVNYGPVGADIEELSSRFGDRCTMLGPLTPEHPRALAEFHKLVRAAVGDPVRPLPVDASHAGQLIALDVSASMESILASSELRDFLANAAGATTRIAMIDEDIRALVAGSQIKQWLEDNPLGGATSLVPPLVRLLSEHDRIMLVTDESGLASLDSLGYTRLENPLEEASDAQFVQLTR